MLLPHLKSSDLRDNLGWLLAFLSGLILGFQLWFLFFYSNVGPDISDGSFYVLHNVNPENANIQLRQFGIIFKAFIGEKSIVEGRQITILLTCLVGLIFTFIISHGYKYNLRIFISFVSANAFLLIFTNHLLDFSYNIGILFGFTIFVCALFHSNEKNGNIKNLLRYFFAGVGLGIIFFCKIPVMIILFAVYILHELILFLEGKYFNKLIGNFFTLCLGALVLIGYVSYSVTSLEQVFINMYEGYRSLEILKLYSPSLVYEISKIIVFFKVLFSRMLAHFIGQPQLLFLLIILIAPMLIHLKLEPQKINYIFSAQILSAALVPFTVSEWMFEVSPKTQLNNLHMGFGLCLLLFTILILSTHKYLTKNQIYLVIVLFFGFFINRFLSTNNLYNSSYLYLGLNFSSILLLFCFSRRQTKIFSYVPILFVLMWCVSSSYIYHYNFPYRLTANLKQADVLVSLHEKYGMVKLPRADARIYEELSKLSIYTNYLNKGDWLLIDLTGRVPGVALLHDAYTGDLFWNAGGYPGSGEFMKFGLQNVPKDIVQNTVIISSDEPDQLKGENHIKKDYLNEFLTLHGLVFPNDFLAIGGFHIPYVGYNAKIYISKALYEGGKT